MSGYDVEKFDPPPDPELVCCICTFVLDQPMESPCQHVFCKQCIETWLQQRRNCPTCRKKMSKRHLKPVLPLVQNMLNKLAMICDFRDNGCEEKPTLELYRSHIAKCDYEMLTCKFKSCQAQVLRRDIAVHETDLCEFREVLCLRQCGLHLPIKDINSHDCMQALKKHAEERRKHAEDLEARLKSLMSLQQSLREDVDQLRRQVEEERRRREEQQPWSPSFYSSSNWTTDNEDNEEHTTAEILDSDTDSDSDHTRHSAENNRSADHGLSDSDVEFTDDRHPTPALSVSSNNSDVEIVPPVPDADIERDIDVTFEEEPDENAQDENEDDDEDLSTSRTNNTFDVDGTTASTSQLSSDITQPSEELVKQIINCFGRLGNSNMSNPTVDMVCKYATKVMSSFVKMIQIVKHSGTDASLQTGSSTDTSTQGGSASDTSGLLMDNTGNELTTSVVTESDIFASTSQLLDVSGSTENVYDWSTTDSSQLLDPVIQRLIACSGSGFDFAKFQEMASSSANHHEQHHLQHKPVNSLLFKDQEATSTNHLVPDSQDETHPLRINPDRFRSDDLDELLASAIPPSERSVTENCEDTCICISSTDDLEEAGTKTDEGQQEKHSGVYGDVAAEDPEFIPPTLKQNCKTTVKAVPNSAFKRERQKRQHSQLDSSNSDFSKKMKICLTSSDNDPRASLHLWNSNQKNKKQSTLPIVTSLVHGPVSCTVTSETVSSDCTQDVFTNYQENYPQPVSIVTSEPTVQPAPKVRQGRRIHFPEPPGETREIVDVPVPRGTAQLLEEFSGDSDSSWEPGNSEDELETEEISSSHDEDSLDSF